MNHRAIPFLMTFFVLSDAAVAAPNVTASAVWSRPAVGTGVVYATINDAGPHADVLVSAASPVASSVELHQTVAAGGSGAGSSGMAGISRMMMRPVRAIPVPAHGSVQLKPGGYHIMLIGLHRPLEPGQRFPITLRFRDAGTVHVVSRVVTER